jgi:tripartite-type tricarboxylate transporter receptor subunit TctC
MKFHRRQFLHLVGGAAALPAVSRLARAQTYPSRPVRLIAPFSAGGAADIFARLIGQWLSERLGQPVIVENRLGAGGNVATEMVARAPPDGYTLLQVTSSNAWNPALYPPLNFNFIRDIVPIAGLVRGVGVLVVIPSFSATTVPEFIALAKAHPGKINMASAGIGSAPHIYGELFKKMAGVDMVHVPYRGGATALTDLVAGHVPVMFDTLASSVEHIRAGRLRALAVTSAMRSEMLPGVPTVGEFVAGYEATAWTGIGAPTNTPGEIVEKLNREINAGLADSKIKARIADLGYTPFVTSPADFTKIIAKETEKWAEVIQAANIKME